MVVAAHTMEDMIHITMWMKANKSCNKKSYKCDGYRDNNIDNDNEDIDDSDTLTSEEKQYLEHLKQNSWNNSKKN